MLGMIEYVLAVFNLPFDGYFLIFLSSILFVDHLMELSHFSLFLWSLVLFRFPSNYISNTVIQYIIWEQTVEYQYFLFIGWIWEIVIFYRKPPRYFPISFPIFIWLVSVFSSVILRIIRFSSSNCMFVNNRDPAHAAVSTLFCLTTTGHLC